MRLCGKKGTLSAFPFIFIIIYRSFRLRIRNVSRKSCRENQNKILCCITFFFSKIVPLMRLCGKTGTLRDFPLIYIISLISPKNKNCFTQKSQRKSKHNFMLHNFFPKIVPFMRLCGKTGTLRDFPLLFMITSRSFLLRIRNVSDKSCRGNKTQFYVA